MAEAPSTPGQAAKTEMIKVETKLANHRKLAFRKCCGHKFCQALDALLQSLSPAIRRLVEKRQNRFGIWRSAEALPVTRKLPPMLVLQISHIHFGSTKRSLESGPFRLLAAVGFGQALAAIAMSAVCSVPPKPKQAIAPSTQLPMAHLTPSSADCTVRMGGLCGICGK